MAGEDLAVPADGQSFSIHAIASAPTAISVTPTASTAWEGGQEDVRNNEYEARSARIHPVGEGTMKLIEGRLADKIGKGAKAFGLKRTDINGE